MIDVDSKDNQKKSKKKTPFVKIKRENKRKKEEEPESDDEIQESEEEERRPQAKKKPKKTSELLESWKDPETGEVNWSKEFDSWTTPQLVSHVLTQRRQINEHESSILSLPKSMQSV